MSYITGFTSNVELGNASAVSISGGNAGQVLSTTDGQGNLAWIDQSGGGSYGDANVSAYLASGDNSNGFFTNGNISAGSLGDTRSANDGVSTPTEFQFNYGAELPNPFTVGGTVRVSGVDVPYDALNGVWTVTSTSPSQVTIATTSDVGTADFSAQDPLPVIQAVSINSITATGNITGAYIIGDGSQLSNLTVPPTTWYTLQDKNGTGAPTEIAIGFIAGDTNQGQSSVAVGVEAGQTDQGAYSVAVGVSTGTLSQGIGGVAVGSGAGYNTQGFQAVAIGASPAANLQGANAIAIGAQAASDDQGADAIAIGTQAGYNAQGANSIAIGAYAGYPAQVGNSIVINATGANLPSTESGLYVDPVRNDTGNVTNVVYYNTTTKEVTYGPAGGGGSYGDSNVTTLLASGTVSSNIVTTANVNAGALNLTGNFSIKDPGQSFGPTLAISSPNTSFGITVATPASGISINYNVDGNGANSVDIGTPGGFWTYDASGNLNLPTNTSSINYANGASILTNVNGIANATSNVSIPVADGPIMMYDGGVPMANIGVSSIAIGANAQGNGGAGANTIAIGYQAGNITQGQRSVAIGQLAGSNAQGIFAVAIGRTAGQTLQGQSTVAIGSGSGATSQSQQGVAIGDTAGATSQGIAAVAIGRGAAQTSQGRDAVAIGSAPAGSSQGEKAIAIGYTAGQAIQGANAIAIGTVAAGSGQSVNAIAIGLLAGNVSQGANSIAIGANAGVLNQVANSIIINATGANLDATVNSGFYVAPVRNDVGNAVNSVFYNTSTSEVTYAQTSNSVIAGSNTIVSLNNITALVGGTPTRLFIGTVSGNMTVAGQSQTMLSGSMAVSSWINVPITEGTGNGFAMSGALSQNGETAVLNITDQGAGTGTWRVTGMIANTAANLYSVSIEKLA